MREHNKTIRTRGRKMLIVLDDKRNTGQLKNLIGNKDWFGRGSKIMTTKE